VAVQAFILLLSRTEVHVVLTSTAWHLCVLHPAPRHRTAVAGPDAKQYSAMCTCDTQGAYLTVHLYRVEILRCLRCLLLSTFGLCFIALLATRAVGQASASVMQAGRCLSITSGERPEVCRRFNLERVAPCLARCLLHLKGC